MVKFYTAYKKYFAVFIIIALAVPTVIVSNSRGIGSKEGNAYAISNDDKNIASDMSNMTGVSSEEILRLKAEGNNWNRILDMLKSKGNTSDQDERNRRSKLLAENGLNDENIKKLSSEGFSDKEITEARAFIERVIFQLNEITSGGEAEPEVQHVNDAKTISGGYKTSSDNVNNPSTGTQAVPAQNTVQDVRTGLRVSGDNAGLTAEDNKDKELEPYKELLNKIDINNAVYLSLKLKSYFGDEQKVFDEYIFSLQIGLNLETFITDSESYKKEKEEKSKGIDLQNIITIAKIESKLFEIIQMRNSKGPAKQYTGDEGLEKAKTPEKAKSDDFTSQSPVPDVNKVISKNPAEDIMKEINDIRSNSLNNR